jgi:hypothetical protein
MDRNEAVKYLKDLLKICYDMSPEALSFENSQTGEYDGYCVRIKGTILDVDKNKVKELAKKHNLIVKEEKGQILIFSPK